MSGDLTPELFEHAAPPANAGHVGFRLHRLEVYNWGTFHDRVWTFRANGENALLTGDIGSGKSTLVDAVTTLLVPPQRIAYNKAAGADTRERTLRSYVLGHYKSERSESGHSAKPVALRDHNRYSVLLAHFRNEGFAQDVTLAQVFWIKDVEGQPARLFLVAETPLSIAEHFAGFGADINGLRKKLRRLPQAEVFESFPPYSTAFRRRFGINNDQALDLFHQTVSMKAVGNLTEFVRQHMLEPFDFDERIDNLISHFDDLNRAHELVLKARLQVERLVPIVDDGRRQAQVAEEIARLRRCREGLRPWFATLKAGLLERRLTNLDEEIARLIGRIDSLKEKQGEQRGRRDELKRAISENGGDRLERLKVEIAQKQQQHQERFERVSKYNQLAASVGLHSAIDLDTFLSNQRAAQESLQETEVRLAAVQNELLETSVDLKGLRDQHTTLLEELKSLRQRRSNIPAQMLRVRTTLCQAVGLSEEELPFTGELLKVHDDEREWEGAIERVLHGFGLSMLVADRHYSTVAKWVERTHLGVRFVYFRVPDRQASRRETQPKSLVRKLAVKPDSDFYGWLEAELSRRFDYVCCDNLDEFRLQRQAITRAGQIKGEERHEKDDRSRIDDRSRFILGWSNEEKIAVIEQQAKALELRMQKLAVAIARLTEEQQALNERRLTLRQLAAYESFGELDWQPLVVDIDSLERERRQLESESDQLRVLQRQLEQLETELKETEQALSKEERLLGDATGKRSAAQQQLDESRATSTGLPEAERAAVFPQLEAMLPEALENRTLTVESCQRAEQDMRDWIQGKLDAEESRRKRLAEKIIQAMQAFRHAFPSETTEADASPDAWPEYAKMLERLQTDDLPRFEKRFKEALNENTIREVAGFRSALDIETQTIRERIDRINGALRDIDYNPGRYIELVLVPTTDPEIRDFRQDLRACTEGALTGSEDETYSEAKFLQVKRIIERFRGRENLTDLDRRWTWKVSDTRNWFTFSASERWHEDGREHEHYTDSGGKSGGQKEKLAYTVLAASLAYQFGLERDVARSRSFRFVVIDEAFGRGSDESTRYGLELFEKLSLQLLIVTPLQKIHIIEPHVSSVGFVHNEEGRLSRLRTLTIEEYRAEKAAHGA